MKLNKNTILKILINVATVGTALLLIYLALKNILPGFFDILAEGNQADMQEYLRSFNDFEGYAIGFLLQFIQIITIFLPSVPIQIAVGIIFGTWRGFLVCYSGYVSANALIFILSRKLGAGLEKLFPSKRVSDKNRNMILHSEHPALTVLIASVIPLIPNGLIPYIASKTKIHFGSFILAVGIGCVPTVLTLCAVGGQLNAGDWLAAALYILLLFILAGLLFWQQNNIARLYSSSIKHLHSKLNAKSKAAEASLSHEYSTFASREDKTDDAK